MRIDERSRPVFLGASRFARDTTRRTFASIDRSTSGRIIAATRAGDCKLTLEVAISTSSIRRPIRHLLIIPLPQGNVVARVVEVSPNLGLLVLSQIDDRVGVEHPEDLDGSHAPPVHAFTIPAGDEDDPLGSNRPPQCPGYFVGTPVIAGM